MAMEKTVERITFNYRDEEFVVHGVKGTSPIPVRQVMDEFAERYKNDDLRKKLYFANALKEGKLEGATVTKIEQIEIERRRF